jgi:hypothetical protein
MYGVATFLFHHENSSRQHIGITTYILSYKTKQIAPYQRLTLQKSYDTLNITISKVKKHADSSGIPQR